MGTQSNTSVFALAGAVAAIIFWALGSFLPDVPPGIEAAATTVIATVIAWFAPADLLQRIPKRAGPLVLALGLGLALGTPACATTQNVNAVAAAQTLEQKTFALYGTFVWAEGVAADIAEDPDVPDEVALALYDGVRHARPPIRTAFELAVTAAAIRQGFRDGDVSAVLSELDDAYARARGPVSDLVALVKGD